MNWIRGVAGYRPINSIDAIVAQYIAAILSPVEEAKVKCIYQEIIDISL